MYFWRKSLKFLNMFVMLEMSIVFDMDYTKYSISGVYALQVLDKLEMIFFIDENNIFLAKRSEISQHACHARYEHSF